MAYVLSFENLLSLALLVACIVAALWLRSLGPRAHVATREWLGSIGFAVFMFGFQIACIYNPDRGIGLASFWVATLLQAAVLLVVVVIAAFCLRHEGRLPKYLYFLVAWLDDS